MAYLGRKLPFAVFLLVLCPGSTASPQGVSPSSKPENSPDKSRALSGVFLYTYRTPAHMKYSSHKVFQEALDEVSRFLTSKNVPVRKIVQAAPSRYRERGSNEEYENLSVSRDNLSPSLISEARASGARYVLFLVVDRPVMSWIQLKMRCFDLSGSLLWEAQSANMSALSGKDGLQQTLEGLEGRISSKTEELSRAFEEAPTPSPVAASTQAGTTAQSVIVLPQPSLPGVEKYSTDAAPGEMVIEKGQPVLLLLLDTISSKDLRVADRIRFRVLDPVVTDNLVVAPERAEAWGTVTAIQAPRRKLKSAEVIITIQQLVLLNGNMAPLNAVWRIRAHLSAEQSREVVEGVLQSYMLALPFVPFMHGDEVNIVKGTEFSAVFAERIALDRAEIERLQPPTVAPPTGPATLTFYDIDENYVHHAIWCGKVKLGKLLPRTRYTIELPAATYWVRTESKKNAFPVAIEPGGEYFVRITSIATSEHAYMHHIEAVKHDVGEVQVSDTKPLDSKHHLDFSKADPVLLRAKPTE